MNIIWYGQSCFKITANGKNNEAVEIVIDPFPEELGLKVPKLSANIVLSTHDHADHNNVKAVSGTPFFILGPGEYDTKGVFIQGISAFHDNSGGKEKGKNVIYTIESEDIRICHLGDLGQKELAKEQLEEIGNVDILMIPIGGNYTIDGKEALDIMAQIEPRIIIPMHYSLPKLETKLDGLDKFLKHLGIKSPEPLQKLSVKKKDLSDDEAKIVVLQP